MPSAVNAFEIHSAASRAYRSVLEARLLTGATQKHVARDAGVKESVVAFYEAAFFDVRDRWAAQDFVVHHVLLGNCPRNDPDALRDAVWKIIAYVGGVTALEAVIRGPEFTGPPVSREKILGGLAHGVELAAQQAAAFVSASPSPENLRLAKSLQELAVRARDACPAGQSTEDKWAEAVKAMLEGLPWRRVNRHDAFKGVPEGIAKFEREGIGLRSGECLRILAGETLEDEEEIFTARFPEQEERDRTAAGASFPPEAYG
jgi:hypothetical protein